MSLVLVCCLYLSAILIITLMWIVSPVGLMQFPLHIIPPPHLHVM
ncbi:uncharacterized protein DEA37_0002685 [Paragonimus westermani]|uniref:Uncharacterized protein n=1 Tax=Paragonimus westermani TaxID=34504 RepID=A0A5J4NL82_9TREM|nr:uncharacterized protein DEA37_0002685 [Paragonimus westermani]